MDVVPVPGVVVARVLEAPAVAEGAASDTAVGDAVGEAASDVDVQPTNADTASRVSSATTFRTAMSAGYVRPTRSRGRKTNT